MTHNVSDPALSPFEAPDVGPDVPIIKIGDSMFRLIFHDLVRPLTDGEYAGLKDSIERFGIRQPISVASYPPLIHDVIDGAHRLQIAADLGWPLEKIPRIEVRGTTQELRDMAISLNLDRRHMSIEERRQRAAELRAAGHSYRAIGERLGVSQVTARADVQAAGVKSLTPETITGKDGKTYRAAEPEPTEADIVLARDLIPEALRTWTRPVNLGSIANQVRRLPGGAEVTRKAVKAALARMIQAGNVVELKDTYNRTVYALAHDPALGARLAEANNQVIDELNAKFDKEAITLLGRTDDGAEHRAIEVARRLVAAGVWDGQTPIQFNAYLLHDKLFGPPAVDPKTLVDGPGEDYRLFDPRALEWQPRILEMLASGPIELAQIRARLGIALSDQDGMKALRETLAMLVNGKQLRQVRDLYFLQRPEPAAPARPATWPPRYSTDLKARVLETIAVSSLPLEVLCERLGMTGPAQRSEVQATLGILLSEDKVQEHRGMWSLAGAELPSQDDEGDAPAPLSFERYRKYAVPAESIEDFLARYYKADRYTGRGEEYASALRKSYQERFEADGYVFISHHDSKTGEIVAYYGKPAGSMEALLDQPVSRGGADDWERELPPTQTSQDADRIFALLGKHAPLPLRMKHIRDQLDMPEERFTRARMLLEAGRLILVDGESLKLAPQPQPEPPIDTTEVTDEPNGNGSVHFSSDSEEWYTPADIVERVIQILIGIDLDPCSNSQESPNIPAATHYSKEEDGLAQEWAGKVFLNPPYGRTIPQWIDKLVTEYRAGRVTQAIALVPARTDTDWFGALREFPRCFVQGRITFLKPDGSKAYPAPFPSALVYLGPDIDRFAEVFADLGDIYVRYQAPKDEDGDLPV